MEDIKQRLFHGRISALFTEFECGNFVGLAKFASLFDKQRFNYENFDFYLPRMWSTVLPTRGE